jgi:glutathione synthase/RimK-type ligase-like ATP-grasp enzyme
MMKVMSKVAGDGKYQLVNNKEDEYAAYGDFIHRDWIIVKPEDKDAKLTEFVKGHGLTIAKPTDSDFGRGVMKIERNNDEALRTLLRERTGRTFILEECLDNCYELKQINPSSLNTIRVVTISDKDRCEVFGALLRMGAHGSVIDNTHAGGVYAPINVETGTIDIEAIDSRNHHYSCHPDSGKTIKGFKIPMWEQIKETCKEATQTIPNIHFAGWDLCITKEGQVEIIEGNHAPDFDGGMQAPLKIGVKKKLQQTVIDVMGIDPIQLIPIWKNRVNN